MQATHPAFCKSSFWSSNKSSGKSGAHLCQVHYRLQASSFEYVWNPNIHESHVYIREWFEQNTSFRNRCCCSLIWFSVHIISRPEPSIHTRQVFLYKLAAQRRQFPVRSVMTLYHSGGSTLEFLSLPILALSIGEIERVRRWEQFYSLSCACPIWCYSTLSSDY